MTFMNSEILKMKVVKWLVVCKSTLTQNKNCTLFKMGFTIPEIKTPLPPNAGNELQSCVGMLNFISLGSKFIKKIQIKA